MVHRIAIWRYFYFIRAFVFQKLKPTMNLKLQLKSWCHLICCWTESHLDPLYLNCIARKSLVFKVTSSKFEWSHTCGEYCHHLIQGNPEKYNRKQQMYLRINKNACIINEAFSTPLKMLKYWPSNWLVKSNFQKKILR